MPLRPGNPLESEVLAPDRGHLFTLLPRILSFALLTCSAALFFGEYVQGSSVQPESLFARRGAGYISSDADAVGILESQLATGKVAWANGIPLLLQTVTRDPASPQHWCELGEALARAGDFTAAEYAYLRGGELGPHSPAILLDLGDFYVNAGKYRLALPYLSELLKISREPADGYMANVFEYYATMDVRGKGWFDAAIPDGEAARAWLNYIIFYNKDRSVTDLWEWAVSRGFVDDGTTVSYTNFLLRREQFDAAALAWAKHFRGRGYDCIGSSCIFNGDFEHEPSGGPFDWHVDEAKGITAERDRVTRYEGQYSLRLDFTGNDNPFYQGVKELVAVEPGRYRLEGYVRTSRITGDEGIRFRANGTTRTQSIQAETPAAGGTEGWKRLSAEFLVPEGVRELDVRVIRRKSLRIDNQITGTAWIDSVRLTRLR